MRATRTLLYSALLWASACSSDEGEPAPGGSGGAKGSTQAGYGGRIVTYGGASFGGFNGFGGSSTLGGVSAFGGSPATASECAVCQRAQACCLALAEVQYADPDPCLTFTTNCGMFSGTAEETIVASCQAYLVRAKSKGLPACQ